MVIDQKEWIGSRPFFGKVIVYLAFDPSSSVPSSDPLRPSCWVVSQARMKRVWRSSDGGGGPTVLRSIRLEPASSF
jgi:hypothetical protein